MASERIGDSENSRPQRDFLTPQTARISCAVKIFLMRKHNFRSFSQERDACNHIVSDFAMGAHHFSFFRRKRPRLAQDLVRDGHFPNIVKKCRARNLREQ